MPDLLAGSTVRAIDTPPTVADFQPDGFTFDSTTFGIDADTGTYADCGVAFVAPTTGRVLIHYAAGIASTTGVTMVSPVVRTGGTVGSGSTVVAASSDDQISHRSSPVDRFGATTLVTGLTAGDTYNVRLEHFTSSGTGTLQRRSVIVQPAT